MVLVIGQLQQGGAEGQLVHLARGLAGSAYEPSVACLSEVAEPHASLLRSEGVPVTVLPRRKNRDLGRVRALADLLRKSRADLVHAFLVGANAYAYAASRLAGVPRLVASSRTSMPARNAASWLIHAWVFNHASAVITNSRFVRDFTASHYGVPAARIRVVPNGVDPAPFRAAVEAASRVRGDWGVGEADVLIGTLGRLSREKNLELFVEMAARLAREHAGLRFAIIGDGPHRGAVESAVRRTAPDGSVILTGARADVPEVLSALDVFVMTSDTEGLPNAVMEAMAAGLPVVATRVGGVHELVTDGETGRLVPPRRLDPLLEAVRPLLTDAALRRRIGEAGRSRIAAEFGLERMIAGTKTVYEEVLAGLGGARAA